MPICNGALLILKEIIFERDQSVFMESSFNLKREKQSFGNVSRQVVL